MKTYFLALLMLIAGCSSDKDKFVGTWENGEDYLIIEKANGDNITIKTHAIRASQYSGVRQAVGHYDSGCECIVFQFGEVPRKVVLTESGIFVDRSGGFRKYVVTSEK